MKPGPKIHSAQLIDAPSVLPTTQTLRQPPGKSHFPRRSTRSFLYAR